MLMMAPGVPAAMWRRANSREQKNVPLSTMSVTARQAFGLMSSAGTGKFPAALLTSVPGSPRACSSASKAAAIWSGWRMSQPASAALPPTASTAATPAARCSGLRLRMPTAAPRRANSTAIALPRPVPPPVTMTAWPSKVPGASALAPSSGGSGRPMIDAPSSVNGVGRG
jgi:hypothetical protein